MNELMVFTSKFGEMRIMYNSIGDAYFNLEDVCNILELKNTIRTFTELDDDEKLVFSNVRNSYSPFQGVSAKKERYVTESGFYSLIFKSIKPEAKAFRKWVTSEVLPEIRKTGSFVLYGKEHQKKSMETLHNLLPELEKKDKINYIKANTITNKAVSNVYGFEKMIKKDKMSKDMLELREKILDDYIKIYEITQDTTIIKNLLYAKYSCKLLI